MTVFKRTTVFLLLGLLLAVVTACSRGQKKPEYYDARETEPLVMPEGLSTPDRSRALIIDMPPLPPPEMAMETRPPRISSTTSGIDANSRLNWSAEGLYLMVEDSPESAHRRLGLVIERAGMERIREDEQGVYRFDYYQEFKDRDGFFSGLAFWRRNNVEDYSGAYQAFVRPDGENARVYIKYADGTDCEADAAEHLLEVIRKRLG
ncbi:MAG: hypothetical protein P8Y54_12365 [Xanthomonadales bacterium]